MNRRNAIKAAIGGIAAACGMDSRGNLVDAIHVDPTPLREGMRQASDAIRLYARLTNRGSLTIANIRCIDARVQSVQLSGMTRVPQCRKRRKP